MNIKSEDANMVGKKISQPVNYLNSPIWLEIPCFPIGPLQIYHKLIVEWSTQGPLPGVFQVPRSVYLLAKPTKAEW